MKKYIYILLLLIATQSFGQKLPKGFKEKVRQEYNAGKDEIKMSFDKYYDLSVKSWRSHENFIKNVIQQKSVSDMCSNGTFENGEINTGDWNFYWEGRGGNPFGFFSGSNRKNSGAFTGSPYTYPPADQVHHKVVSLTNDPTISSLMTVPNYPSGNQYALRLGNKINQHGVESVAKKVLITPNNATLSFSYALVMNNPKNLPISQQPAFMVNIRDANTTSANNYGNLVDLGGGSNIIVSSNPFLLPVDSWGNTVYKNWECITADLSSLIGKTVIIEFLNKDCGAGAHWSYTYLDNLCLGCDGAPSDTGSINIKDMPDCGLPNQICVNYTLPDNGQTTGTVKLLLDIIQNGNVINTLTSPVLSSGSQYCFNLTSAGMPGVSTALGGIDFKVTGKFVINNFNLSDKLIGNNAEGIVAGINNDFQLECPSAPNFDCCQTKLDIWNVSNTPPVLPIIQHTANGIAYSEASETFQLHTNSTIPITELNVVITDIEYEYNYKDCAKCMDEPVLWGSIYSPNNNIGGSSGLINTRPNINIQTLLQDHVTSRIISWENNQGAMLHNGDTFSVHYLLPPSSDIPCCATHIKICTKISWKDANCKMCEVMTCSTIELKR